MINLNNFFNPKSIAIIGVSRNPKKVGHVLYRNLLDGNFQGKIFIVNKNADTILNQKSYKSILKIKQKVDLTIISVPARFVMQTLKECNKKGVKDILIITSGFAEIGNTELENEMKEYLISNRMRMIGPNCLGVLNAKDKIDTLFLPRYRLSRPEPGGISFVCQSGAVGSTILDLAADKGHKFAKFVSYGNATTIDESDIIEYLGKDPDTKVICLYVEAVKDGRKFIRVMKAVSKKKPIIVIKGGLTEEGNQATLSHTGSLAGNVDVYFGVFKQTGLIRAESLGEMLNFASIFEKSTKPEGKKIQVITNGGGFGILSTDAIVKNPHLQMANLSKDTIKRLKYRFPETATVGNPMDLVGDATTKRYRTALDACLSEKKVNIILLIALYQTPLVTTDIVDVISEANALHKKPIVVVSAGGEFTEVLSKSLEKNNVVTFTFPEEAVKTIGELVKYYVK